MLHCCISCAVLTEHLPSLANDMTRLQCPYPVFPAASLLFFQLQQPRTRRIRVPTANHSVVITPGDNAISVDVITEPRIRRLRVLVETARPHRNLRGVPLAGGCSS